MALHLAEKNRSMHDSVLSREYLSNTDTGVKPFHKP